METGTTTEQTGVLNIPAFWKAQQKDWRITVIRTSLERLGYKIILPYLTLYIILLGATKTQKTLKDFWRYDPDFDRRLSGICLGSDLAGCGARYVFASTGRRCRRSKLCYHLWKLPCQLR